MTSLRSLLPDLKATAVASTTLGTTLTTGVFQFYYVKVFTSRYLISPDWLTIAQCFYIFCNFITEPVIGYLQDFGCTRFCKNRRRIISIGGPLAAIVFLLPWFAPYDPLSAPSWLPGVHLMLVLMLWNCLFVLVGSSWSGLFAEISTDHGYRVKLYKYTLVAGMLGKTALLPIDKLTDSARNLSHLHICVIVVAGMAIACYIFTSVFATDVVAQANDDDEAVTVGVLQVVKAMFTNRDFISAVVCNWFAWCRTVHYVNFLSTYTETLLGRLMPPGSYPVATFYFSCNVLPSLLMALATPIVHYLGTYHTLMLTFVLTWLNCAIGLFLGTFAGYNPLIVCIFMEGVLSAAGGYFSIIISEVIDDDSKRHNRSSPPSVFIFTINGTIVRSAVALMPILVVRLLDLVGYEQYKTHLETSPPTLQFDTFLMCMCLPAILALLQFVSLLPYRLRSKHHSDVTEETNHLIQNEQLIDHNSA